MLDLWGVLLRPELRKEEGILAGIVFCSICSSTLWIISSMRVNVFVNLAMCKLDEQDTSELSQMSPCQAASPKDGKIWI